MSIQQIKGFTVLPVNMESTGSMDRTTHYLYIKKHTTRDEPESKTSSLFIVNIPICSDFDHMKKLFSQITIEAHIESFNKNEYFDLNNVINDDLNINLSKLTNEEFGEKNDDAIRIPVGCGIVKFLDKDSLNLIINSIKKIKKAPTWTLNENEVGRSRYQHDITRLDSDLLSMQVSEFLSDFQQRERLAEEEVNEMKELVDEDGFTLVVGSQRKTKNGIMGSMKKLADLQKDDKLVKKMKKKEKQDFYRFQIRERKKHEMNELLNKFKEDQNRVKLMREKRKFKPY